LQNNFYPEVVEILSFEFSRNMEWIAVISLLLMGITLVILEIVFIPGTTIVGVIGFCVTVAGIYLSFHYFDRPVGWMVTAGTGIVAASALYWSLRSGIWRRFALKNTISGRVNDEAEKKLTVGMEGITVSSLRPMGKAEFSEGQYEVTTRGDLLEPGITIRIISMTGNHIVVEPVS